MKLRVVVIPDPHIPIPPVGYGGAERIVAMLCEGLVKRGFIVDLVAGPGSLRYNGNLTVHRAPSKSKLSRAYRKLLFQCLSLIAARRADVIVSFGRVDYLWSLARTSIPLVQVFQNPANQFEIDFLLQARKKNIRFVGVSQDQMSGMIPSELIDIVHNGTNIDRMTFQPVADSPEYFAFLGRLTANKGVHLAIQAARMAGVKLVIAGNVSDTEPGARAYFETQVKPHIGPLVEYVGPVDDVAKAKLLGGATALLFPIQWKEPCALVLPEALACGCPVIGWRNGSVSEVIREGVTGFVVESIDEMVRAIQSVKTIDRSECRRDCETRFSPETLGNSYATIIDKMIARLPNTPVENSRSL